MSSSISSGIRNSSSIISHNACFTMDVLTDGSEYTGHGTLFLSAWKVPSSGPATAAGTEAEPVDTTSPPLARYAISGVGDATARLCADQRFKLACTRAVFLPEPSRFTQSADGLSALFLALHSAGTPSLHVVAPASSADDDDRPAPSSTSRRRQSQDAALSGGDDWIEELASITLGRHKHFDIRTCQVRPENANGRDGPITWWTVYEDEYIEVHAGCCPEMHASATHSTSLIYLYSFRQRTDDRPKNRPGSFANGYSTLAALPPSCLDPPALYLRLKGTQDLPMIRGRTPMTIDYVVALNYAGFDHVKHPQTASIDRRGNQVKHPQSASIDRPIDQVEGVEECLFMLTLPQHHSLDKGLLMRSQQVSQYFHQRMAWAFASPSAPDGSLEVGRQSSVATISGSPTVTTIRSLPPFLLKSGTSVVLERRKMTADHHSLSSPVVLDRRTAIWERPLSDEWASTLESLRPFVPDPSSASPDENEIDLDDDEDDDAAEGRSVTLKSPPQHPLAHQKGHHCNLLVLGTGCATPSAYRGASGYALFMASDVESANEGNVGYQRKKDIFLLDCGEGTTTMLSRSLRGSGLNSDWASQIRGVWISHAHLDHYGGLPTLIRILRDHAVNRKNTIRPTERETKRCRHHDGSNPPVRPSSIPDTTVPWVIAPPKVLRYLDIVLDCRHGLSTDRSSATGARYFWPRVHHDPTPPSGPWLHFEPIPVDHNCCPSYGLLLGWATPRGNDSNGGGTVESFLCYSGDTRPCHGVVQACRRVLSRAASNPSSQMRNSIGNKDAAVANLFLVHEATFADAAAEDARKKKHSTVSEAVRVAEDIPATRVLLSHFSQRYVSLDGSYNGTQAENGNEPPLRLGDSIPMGLATDGLWIPLD